MVLLNGFMFQLFKSKPLLSEADLTFQVATYAWLLKHFGGDDFYKTTQLVLPTSSFFPEQVSEPKQAALATFESVKQHAGMATWQCQLVAQDDDINPVVSPTMVVQNAPVQPNGTFQATEDNNVVITYKPSLIGQPIQLVATLAHELSHYLTATAQEPPPGGWENWEFATDITATFLGFGIFMANSAFNFRQYSNAESQGWQSNTSGYLSEQEHIYALAIFLKLKQLPISHALVHLKPHFRKFLKKADKELDKSGYIAELSEVVYQPNQTDTDSAYEQ